MDDKINHNKKNPGPLILSPTRVGKVILVTDENQQTEPTRTPAELLADGQCEV